MLNKIMSEYVQFGCGMNAAEGWRNFDASPTLWFERTPFLGALYTKNQQRFPDKVEFGNIVQGLNLPSESCCGIYASHVLEHLTLEDCKKALQETYRLLKPSGIFRLIVPDLNILASKYLTSKNPDAAHLFMRNSMLGVESRPRAFIQKMSVLFGHSQHLWMWDYRSMEHELEEVGFKSIRQCCFNDSEDLAFKKVEVQARFENAVAIEARK